jgi:tRNA(adenine34) deaminase
MNNDEKWMQIAINESIASKSNDEVPVGAVIVRNGQLIAQAHNQPISTNDPTAHAEILAIRKAGKKEKNYRLVGATLYVTLEPCLMCLGALMHARIERIVFGAKNTKNGFCGSLLDMTNDKQFNHRVIVTGGILEKQCQEILRSFFRLRR